MYSVKLCAGTRGVGWSSNVYIISGGVSDWWLDGPKGKHNKTLKFNISQKITDLVLKSLWLKNVRWLVMQSLMSHIWQ